MKNETQFKLEDGIPLTPSKRGNGATPKYPFRVMKRGQSFLIPAKTAEVKRVRNTVGALTNRYGKILNRKFAARVTEAGIRVWRVA